MKGTAGRIPRGPQTLIHPMTVVIGCLARSVRDVCRWFDVAHGFDARDPYSLPRIDGWERDLGTYDLRGKRVAIAPTLGGAVVRDEVQERVVAAGEALAREPASRWSTSTSTLPELDVDLGDGQPRAASSSSSATCWPACKDDLTLDIGFGLEMATSMIDPRRRRRRSSRPASTRTRRWPTSSTRSTSSSRPPTPTSRSRPTSSMNTRVGDLSVRPGNNGALDHPGEHQRQPGDLDPDRAVRRAARRPAGHRPPPPGRPAPRPRSDRGAGVPGSSWPAHERPIGTRPIRLGVKAWVPFTSWRPENEECARA